MRKSVKVSINPKLDAVWDSIPRCDRYTIGNQRWAMYWWPDGLGTLMPLADYAEVSEK